MFKDNIKVSAGNTGHIHNDQYSEHAHHNMQMENIHMHHTEPEHKGYNKHEGHKTEDFRKRLIVSVILTIPILFLSPMFLELIGIKGLPEFGGNIFILFILASAVYFYGGYPFLAGMINEIKHRRPGMMTLITVAITVAYIYSSSVVFGIDGDILFWELATLIDIMLLGHWIEMRSIGKASNALNELVKLLPDNAHKISGDGSISDIPISEIKNHDKLLIKPGEKIPADGRIIEGITSINESMITGESVPVNKSKNDFVIGGSVNGEGSIKILIDKTGEETFLSQVIKLVKEAQESKSATQVLADKAAFVLTIIAVTGGIITLIAWLLFSNQGLNFAITRMVTVMVIACPHALGLAIPLVVSVSTSISAKKGLLIKNRTAFETARKVNAVVFDKTGTLTEGNFGVDKVNNFSKIYSNTEILKYAASVESESEHPIAKAIVNSSDEKFSVSNFRSIPGKGAEANIDGKNIKVVSPGYLKENNIQTPDEKDPADGNTKVYLLINNEAAASITLSDKIRKESITAVGMLNAMGIKTIMLTGDNKGAAAKAAGETGIEEYFAGVLPGEKSKKIEEIRSRGYVAAMVGDGINDAPALAKADVGIAIGSGTDVASETSDIILVRNNPMDVVTLIKLARSSYRKMIQNLLWATGYNVIAIPLAAGVLYNAGIMMSPAMGAVLMSLSTIIVSVNARLLKAE